MCHYLSSVSVERTIMIEHVKNNLFLILITLFGLLSYAYLSFSFMRDMRTDARYQHQMPQNQTSHAPAK